MQRRDSQVLFHKVLLELRLVDLPEKAAERKQHESHRSYRLQPGARWVFPPELARTLSYCSQKRFYRHLRLPHCRGPAPAKPARDTHYTQQPAHSNLQGLRCRTCPAPGAHRGSAEG